MLADARSKNPAEPAAAFEAFNLRCTHCSWKRSGIVTREYASTLRIQHEFRYDKHVVMVEQ